MSIKNVSNKVEGEIETLFEDYRSGITPREDSRAFGAMIEKRITTNWQVHILPENCYRIENLGTGQVRLNYSLNQVWDELEWDRPLNKFFDIFTDLAITHYKRVNVDVHIRKHLSFEI